MSTTTYQGTELDLFATARVWKEYLASHLAPFLGSQVLEVGAGIGGTTRALLPFSNGSWTCLEPDPAQAERIAASIRAGSLPSRCTVITGTLGDLPATASFDTILYIDVLEHLSDDREELAHAARRLAPGGCLVVLAPAHQKLFTPFDAAIGHKRRYGRRSLECLSPPGLELVRSLYLDSVGLLASACNHFLLGSSMPTPLQIAFWDGILVRCSKLLDPLTGFRLGKSLLTIWRKSHRDR
ncbi:MAG TPA: class I SAM-dependent methyltransferase [Candidatus Ozemobacteraceae bacterium]